MIQNLGKYAHARNPNKGRHAIGANPAPGSGVKPPNKSSQTEPASNKVTTGSKTFGAPRLPMTNPTNQAAQAQSQLSANPAPFKNPAGAANAPTPATMPYGSTFKHTVGQTGSRAPKNPPAGPVGGFKPKTLAKQVGYRTAPRKVGKMTASATKGGHSLLYGD